MERKRSLFPLFNLILLIASTCSGEMFLEPGVFEFKMEMKPAATGLESAAYIALSKSMFADAEVGVEVSSCMSSQESCNYLMSWTLRQSDCDGIFKAVYKDGNKTVEQMRISNIYTNPDCFLMEQEDNVEFTQYHPENWDTSDPLQCIKESPPLYLPETTLMDNVYWNCSQRVEPKETCNKRDLCGAGVVKPTPASNTQENGDSPPAGDKSKKEKTKRAATEEDGSTDDQNDPGKQEAGDKKTDQNTEEKKTDAEEQVPAPAPENQETKDPEAAKNKDKTPATTAKPAPASNDTVLRHKVVKTLERDGRFIFILRLQQPLPPFDAKTDSLELNVKVFMKSPSGYLSATQYSLLPFYGVMCGVYSILALVWLYFLSRQWRDLLRIQFWISAVIVLGLIEKAAFVAEFDRHNKTGESSNLGVFVAEELSVLKRTMARILVIIVSLGYGITRPRLGNDQNWVLGAGVLFFFLSSLEAYFRITKSETNGLIALLPLSVLDAVLCWWIFRSLVDTTRTLRLRRNLVKLWLYRHFTNALIFCVVAALVFLIWSIKVHKMNLCVKKWNELWLDDAYWHILFCVILVVIMILLRPTANNQRYAYSVLSDAADDDDSKEPMINDAYENLKMRPGHNKTTSQNNREEDDLEWVEKNFPATMADKALGALDDSEEELITSVERNKME